VVSAALDGRVILSESASGATLREWHLPCPVHSVAFAADGRHLATANANGTVYILRIAEGPPRALNTDEAKKQQEDEAKRLGVPVQITNSIGMKLNLIPAGRFLMGSPDDEPRREANEGPRHEVTITKPFYIGIYEVTQAEYEKVAGKNPSHFNKGNGGGLDHPVEMVSWEDAVAFCKKLSELAEEKKAGRVYRLPTEAEWEYACRAGGQGPYSCGDIKQLTEHAWCLENAKGCTHPVGGRRPNAWGLYDMHGNVWEWCHDRFQEDYYKISPAVDAAGGKGDFPCSRGGAYNDAGNVSGYGRAATRGRCPANTVLNSIGFRVVCDYRPPQITNSTGMKLARIPAGKFLMGSPKAKPAGKAMKACMRSRSPGHSSWALRH
jgi:formylglycine-generating enzyme required for sulfatase activity